MKKTSFLIPIVVFMFSCGNNASKTGLSQSKSTDSDTTVKAQVLKDTVKKDTTKAHVNSAVIGTLLGAWAKKGSDNATFEISKDSIYYPEHTTSYAYQVKGDSIRIKYDGFDGNYAYKLKGKDELVLIGDDGEHNYVRIP